MPVDCVVETDSAAAASALRAIIGAVVAAGGEVRPGTRLTERDGQLTVHWAGGDSTGDAELFRVPRRLLVPANGIAWAADDSQLRVAGSVDHLAPERQEMLGLLLELYNACGKLPSIARTHPRVAMRDEPAILRSLSELRPGFRPFDRSVAEVLIGTRMLRLPAVPSSAPPSAPGSADAPRMVFMPLVDLLNNHPQGAGFRVDADALTTRTRRAPESDECFARYGHRSDCVDLALAYGYLDTNVTFARSLACSVEVDGAGLVQVQGSRHDRVHPLDPPRVEATEDGLRVSHLTFDTSHPHGVTALLGMAVRAHCMRRGASSTDALRVSQEVIDEVVRRNEQTLLDVVRASRECRAGNEAVQLVAAACERQVGILRSIASSRAG